MISQDAGFKLFQRVRPTGSTGFVSAQWVEVL